MSNNDPKDEKGDSGGIELAGPPLIFTDEKGIAAFHAPIIDSNGDESLLSGIRRDLRPQGASRSFASNWQGSKPTIWEERRRERAMAAANIVN